MNTSASASSVISSPASHVNSGYVNGIVQPTEDTTQPWLWVSVLVFAHLLAAAFLCKTLSLAYPGLWGRLGERLLQGLQRSSRCRQVTGVVAGKGNRQEPSRAQEERRIKEAKGCRMGKGIADARRVVDESPGPQASSSSGGRLHTVLELPPELVLGSAKDSRGGAATQTPSTSQQRLAGKWLLGGESHKQLGQQRQERLPDDLVMRRAPSLVSPVILEWRDLGCSYKVPGGRRVVLQGVYGAALPGEMHALLGPSGAGKSTLMDILAQRKQVGDLTGSLWVNGRPAGPHSVALRAAYVPQEDTFIPVMTAGETLSFVASLVLPPRMSCRAREARCREVLAAVGLAHCTHTLVGGRLPGGLALRGLSGGERRRLAIASGVLAAPSAILLDEPTSGLDSFAALTVMRYLQMQAQEAGHVVIASIHQPRSGIWSMFDAVSVLSKGMLLYTGPRTGMVPWFTQGLNKSLGAEHTSIGDTAAEGSLLQAVAEEVGPLDDDAAEQGAPDSPSCTKKRVFWYCPETHGVASDWVMDVVSVGFAKEQEAEGEGDEEHGGAAAGSRTLRTEGELHAAAAAFLEVYLGDGFQWQGLEMARSLRTAGGGTGHEGDLEAEGLQEDAGDGMQVSPGNAAPHIPGAAAAGAWAEVVLEPQRSTRLGQTSPGKCSLGEQGRGLDEELGQTPAGHAAEAGAQAQSASGVPPCTPAAAPHHAADLLFHKREQAVEKKQSWKLNQLLSSSPRAHEGTDQALPACTSLRARLRQAWVPTPLIRAFVTFKALLWREVIGITRNPADVAGRILTFSWIAAFCGLVFYAMPLTPEALRLRLNVHFTNTAIFMLMPYISISLYVSDRQFFLADVGAHLYHPAFYYMAKICAHTPFTMLYTALFMMIISGMAGLRHDSQALGEEVVLAALLSLVAVQVLHCAAIIAPNQDIAFMVCLSWTTVNILLSYFLISPSEMTLGWVARLRFLSAQAYAYGGLARAELGGLVYNCSQGLDTTTLSLLPALLPNTSVVSSPLVISTLRSPGPGCTAHAEALLQYFGLTRSFRATAGILVAYWGAMHAVTYAALLMVSRRERR